MLNEQQGKSRMQDSQMFETTLEEDRFFKLATWHKPTVHVLGMAILLF